MGYSVSPSPGTGRRVVERERSRRGKVGAGLLKTAVNAVVQNPFGRYFAGPLVVRFAAAVCAGVLVAALIDLTLAPPSPALVYLAVGALAGGGAGGAGGALVGACWGWLAGEIADAALSSAAAEPATRYFPDLVAWGSATVAGWLGGTATRRCFDLLVRRVPGGVVRALEGLLLTTVLASVSILVSFKLGLLVRPPRLAIPAWLRAWRLPEPSVGQWIGLGTAWLLAVAAPIAATLAYWDWQMQPGFRKFILGEMQPQYGPTMASWTRERLLAEAEEDERLRHSTSFLDYLQLKSRIGWCLFWLQWVASASVLTVMPLLRRRPPALAIALGLLLLWVAPWLIAWSRPLLRALSRSWYAWSSKSPARRANRANRRDMRAHRVVARLPLPTTPGARRRWEARLRSRNPRIRYAAVELLRTRRPPWTVEALRPLLKDRDMHVRRAAIRALQSLGDPRAIPWLAAHLGGPWDQEVRTAIGGIEAAQIGDARRRGRSRKRHGPGSRRRR